MEEIDDRSDKSSLVELLSRVRTATAPDKYLDKALMLALIPGANPRAKSNAPFTSSIDAALALVERVTPKNETHILQKAIGGACGRIVKNSGAKGECDAVSNHLPLAILDALLSALIDETQAKANA